MAPKDVVDKRIKDEKLGIGPGQPLLNPPDAPEEEPLQDMADVLDGLNLTQTNALRKMITEHGQLGVTISEAEKKRKPLTAKLKGLLPNMALLFSVNSSLRVTRYSSNRESVQLDALKMFLLGKGWKPKQIQECLDACVKVTPVDNLRIAPIGVKDEA